jgi:hypothetical protein
MKCLTQGQLLVILHEFVNGAEGLSDIEVRIATGSGEQAGKRSEFQIRVWSLGSFFHLRLRFPDLLHRGVMLLVKGECESQLTCVSGAAIAMKHHRVARQLQLS